MTPSKQIAEKVAHTLLEKWGTKGSEWISPYIAKIAGDLISEVTIAIDSAQKEAVEEILKTKSSEELFLRLSYFHGVLAQQRKAAFERAAEIAGKRCQCPHHISIAYEIREEAKKDSPR